MKNFLFLLTILTLILACENQHDQLSNDLESSLHQSDKSSTMTLSSPPAKIDICRYDAEEDNYKVINVSERSWPDHASNGAVRLDDQDGDGFVPDNSCGIGPAGDCDDNDPTVYPGAEEICGNEIDEDCDGVDESCLPTGSFDASSSCSEVNVSSVVQGIQAGDEIFIRFCQGAGLSPVEVCFDTRQFGADQCYYPLSNVIVQLEQGNDIELGTMSKELNGRHCYLSSSFVASMSNPIKATIIGYELGTRTCN